MWTDLEAQKLWEILGTANSLAWLGERAFEGAAGCEAGESKGRQGDGPPRTKLVMTRSWALSQGEPQWGAGSLAVWNFKTRDRRTVRKTS